ncbi:MAG TPA: class I SAM-dependent DNA methyltransferase [Candidatus Moranbacteria bacterium]|nr:class I SAM-dependent DNA methyltransferase [Candidatus Moranbacteria bacterium]
MDKQQAQQIIRDTFENSFDKQRFTKFILDFLNHFEEDTFIHRGYNIPDSYDEYISSWQRLGKFSDGENRIDILIVNLKKETSLEQARSRQRNFVAGYLQGKYGRSSEKEAALVAYVSPSKTDWRFSLVKMDISFKPRKDKTPKLVDEFTPARRWSFLVGANEKSHTAQSRLVNILANDKQAPTLEEIEKSFDIETVTKEFFLKYRELFLRTKEELDRVVKNDPKIKADFEAKGVDTVNFAKKLLGQIVFLYFLQKKGWFGVGRDDDWGTGSKHFLRKLFDKKHSDYKNFYNDILEPLFYEALRIDRSHDDGYYSRFDCKIPFLNGGLFDPIGNYDWVHTDIIIPDELFSNTRKTKEGDPGDGILDIFDRFNFTVKEDEPLEKEVAIDPELLGKAYEKFNAIRPDNYDKFRKALKSGKTGEENKFNKKFGVYYTPREIVHYMCRQSLINYLATELTDCHSRAGGNPVVSKEDLETLIHTGEQVSENEIAALIKEQNIKEGKQKTSGYKLQLSESIRRNAALIDEKLADITVCDPAVGSGAFPVGMMSEIVRARNVLSVFLNDNSRTAYEFKRRCIEHSLYGVDIDPGAVEIAKLRLWLSLVVDEDNIKNIKPLPNLDYKIVCGNSLLGVEKDLFNNELFNELERLKPLFFNETNPTKKQGYKKQIDSLISQITSGHTEFDFEVYFSEVFLSGVKSASGGHRRGGFDVVIANPPYVSHVNYPQKDKEIISKLFTTFKGRADIYVAFYEKGIELLKNKGSLVYISPNKFFRAGYGTALRQYLNDRTTLISIVDFGDSPIFDATTYPCIIHLEKGQSPQYSFIYLKTDNTCLDNSNGQQYEKDYLTNEIWSFEDSAVASVWKKLQTNSIDLEKYIDKQFYRGIVTGLNDAFVIDEKQRSSLISSNSKIAEIIKPYLKGKDVKRWHSRSNAYVIFTYHGIDIKQYPEVLDYLRPFKSALEKRATTGKHAWYELQQPQTGIYHQFDKTKIISTDIAKKCEFTIDNSKSYIDATIFCIPIKDLYLLSILNSTLIEAYYKSISSTIRGDFLRFKKIYVYRIPIKRIPVENQQPFIKLVAQILTAKKENVIADTSALERQIDQMVYRLYNLTPEEIAIVEEKT